MCVILTFWTALSKCSRCLDVRRYLLCKILQSVSVIRCVMTRYHGRWYVRLKMYDNRVISTSDVSESGRVKCCNFRLMKKNVIVVNEKFKLKRLNGNYKLSELHLKRVKTIYNSKYNNMFSTRRTMCKIYLFVTEYSNEYSVTKFTKRNFDVNRVTLTRVMRNPDLCRVLRTCGRAYLFCVCRLSVVLDARDSYIISPLLSSTDFIKLFNLRSQLNLIDCNLISNIFIFNFKRFRQLSSITMAKRDQFSSSIAINDHWNISSGELNNVGEHWNLENVGTLRRHSIPNRFPIVISEICSTVISYYLIIIITNVIPIIFKFVTTVIDMPFYLITYPISGFCISFSNNFIGFSHLRFYLL